MQDLISTPVATGPVNNGPYYGVRLLCVFLADLVAGSCLGDTLQERFEALSGQGKAFGLLVGDQLHVKV